MVGSQGQEEETVFRWGINSISFSAGQEISLEFGSVLILIGPNNSGKSRALRDIETFFTAPGSPRAVVPVVTTAREGTADLFQRWLEERYPTRAVQGRSHFHTKGGNLPADSVGNVWGSDDTLRGAHAFLIHRLDTEGRLTITNRTRSIELLNEPPHAYIHVLQTDEDLTLRASGEVKSAFGVDLVIDWGGGPQVGFYVGEEPQRGAGAERDRVSEAYLKELNRLPRLDLEGDGIRSFAGALLAALCGAHPVLMIDEPEAFLHPPQARRLAAALARTAAAHGRQVIIATHSADVLRGAMEESQQVSVCRITRETTPDADANKASLLAADKIAELWSRPLLRSSAALDGLFHEGVVVCEGDADSRFYEAILWRMEVQERIDRAADLYFVHGGGKGQLAALARAYRSLNTRTAVVADLDLLRKKDDIADVVSALGATFSETEGLYNSVHSALSSSAPVTPLKDFLSRASGILDTCRKSGELSTENRRELYGLLEETADWSEAKRYGTGKLRGGARRDADELLGRWADIGLFLVPVGELECWWPKGPPNKREWFLPAIKRISEDQSSHAEATEFMAGICRWFGYEVT